MKNEKRKGGTDPGAELATASRSGVFVFSFSFFVFRFVAVGRFPGEDLPC